MMALACPSQPALPPEPSPEARARELANRYGKLDGLELLHAMIVREFAGRIALVSSFGAEAAVLLDLVAQVDRATPVIFLDTGRHFPETLAYRDALVARLRLKNVRSVGPHPRELAQRDRHGRLWQSNPDLCCRLRKVLPLERALVGFDAWITGRKRFHGGSRASLNTIEAVNGRIKIDPLAHWTWDRVRAAFVERGLPRHPLTHEGYPSIGCAP